MFLSNLRPFFLLTIFCVIFFQACGSSQSNENKPVSLTVETKTEFPFSTKEPEIYQGDLVINGKAEDRRFVARKNDKSRLDQFRDNVLTTTELRADKVYLIDHNKRVFCVIEGGRPLENYGKGPDFLFFREKEYREFDDLGKESGTRKYKVRSVSGDEVFLYIDEASGMKVKQEFTSGNDHFLYEFRNLKLEVDDAQFTPPRDYRKATWEEYRAGLKQNK